MKVVVITGKGVSFSTKQIEAAPVFQDWLSRLDPNWRGKVFVNAVDGWKGKIHALMATVTRDGNPWPVNLILRSQTVDILTIVTDDIEGWAVFVEQDRDASGGRVFSNPAGRHRARRIALPSSAARAVRRAGAERH